MRLEMITEKKLRELFRYSPLPPGEIFLFDCIDSTNEEAVRLARKDHLKKLHGALVAARQQTEGRGRRGATWFSPRGMSLYSSIILYPSLPVSSGRIVNLTEKLGYLIEKVVKDSCTDPLRVCLKPPNDILVSGRKVIGILLESASLAGMFNYIVAGFGINFFRPQVRIPRNIRESIGFLEDFVRPGIDFAKLYGDIIMCVRCLF